MPRKKKERSAFSRAKQVLMADVIADVLKEEGLLNVIDDGVLSHLSNKIAETLFDKDLV